MKSKPPEKFICNLLRLIDFKASAIALSSAIVAPAQQYLWFEKSTFTDAPLIPIGPLEPYR